MADVPPGVKGMNDILPPEVSKWQFLEQQARDVLEAFAYRELRTPVLEYTPLFVRSVGEVTDVVEKQMYTFDDRDGRSVSLRPEGTASAVRAYIENAQWNKEPVTRWYYLGPMFRHERAQRGRLRQFHQVGAEVFGANEPSIDAEMIAMLVTMFVRFGLPAGAIEVTVNSLGEPEERAAYRETLVGYFSQHRDRLDEDSRRRLETNPLRILDSKNPDVIAVAAGAPKLLDELGEGVARALHAGARAADRARRQARGRPAAGARPRLLHGDDLRDQDRTPASSARRTRSRAAGATTAWSRRWADRPRPPSASRWASSARCSRSPTAPRATSPRWACSSRRWTGRRWRSRCRSSHQLRGKGIRVEIEHRPKNVGAMIKRADKLRARAAVIIGGNEIASGKLTVKDLAHGTQSEVAVADLEAKIRQLLD